MSRLSPENKALIRKAVSEYDKDMAMTTIGGLLFFPLLFLLSSVKGATAKKMDLGPRSTRVFERILADREARGKRTRKAA
jgi:hypothetical protein